MSVRKAPTVPVSAPSAGTRLTAALTVGLERLTLSKSPKLVEHPFSLADVARPFPARAISANFRGTFNPVKTHGKTRSTKNTGIPPGGREYSEDKDGLPQQNALTWNHTLGQGDPIDNVQTYWNTLNQAPVNPETLSKAAIEMWLANFKSLWQISRIDGQAQAKVIHTVNKMIEHVRRLPERNVTVEKVRELGNYLGARLEEWLQMHHDDYQSLVEASKANNNVQLEDPSQYKSKTNYMPSDNY